MKKTTVKCAKCKIEFPSIEATKLSGKNYCPNCAKGRSKEIEINKKLNEFLYILCDKEKDIMPMLTSQVAHMVREYGFKPEGILKTLQYVYNLSEVPPVFKPEYGIESLVVRNYHFARKFYEEILQLHKQSPQNIDEILNTPTKEIHLSQSVIKGKNIEYINKLKDKQYGPAIDLNSIEDEEEEEESLDEEV